MTGRRCTRIASDCCPTSPIFAKTNFISGSANGTAIPSIVLAIISFFIGGWPWVMWGVFLRTVFSLHSTWLVNSATHMWGSQRFDTGDLSTNSFWVPLSPLAKGGITIIMRSRKPRVTA